MKNVQADKNYNKQEYIQLLNEIIRNILTAIQEGKGFMIQGAWEVGDNLSLRGFGAETKNKMKTRRMMEAFKEYANMTYFELDKLLAKEEKEKPKFVKADIKKQNDGSVIIKFDK